MQQIRALQRWFFVIGFVALLVSCSAEQHDAAEAARQQALHSAEREKIAAAREKAELARKAAIEAAQKKAIVELPTTNDTTAVGSSGGNFLGSSKPPRETIKIVATLPSTSPPNTDIGLSSAIGISQDDGFGHSGVGQQGGGSGLTGMGSLGTRGSGIGSKGYGQGTTTGPKGSGSSLIGGKSRWEVGPFTTEADWLDDFPELQDSETDFGTLMTQLVRRMLRQRMVKATSSNEALTPERLEQLVAEGVKYLCDGKLKKLQAIENGEQLELRLIYRLRRVVGAEKFRLVHIRPLTAVSAISDQPQHSVLRNLLSQAALQVADSLLRDMPADMNAIRG